VRHERAGIEPGWLELSGIAGIDQGPREMARTVMKRSQRRGADMRRSPMSENVRHITDAEFDAEVLRSDVPVLVDFWAPWCGPCMRLGPLMERIAAERGAALKVMKVNVDESPGVAGQMGIMSIPAVMLFKGGELQQMLVGLRPKADFDRMIDAVVGAAAPELQA
jgi:thioredoxin